MADGPRIWAIGQDIIIDTIITDPSTALGLTGQASFITLRIRRGSDDRYWDGNNWVVGAASLTMTEFDATNEPGRYVYTLSGSGANTSANTYFAYANISNPPTIEGDDTEMHLSRDFTVRVYESEPA